MSLCGESRRRDDPTLIPHRPRPSRRRPCRSPRQTDALCGYRWQMASSTSERNRRPRRSGSIRSRGRGHWELRLPLPPDPATGRRRQRSVTFLGNRRAAASELRRLAEEQTFSPGDRRATSMRLTALLDAWWQTKRPTLAASTVREYQRIIDTRLKPDLGATHLDRLLPFHLDRYYQRLSRQGLRPGSIRQIHAVLRGALGQAHRWGWLPTNPAHATRPPRRTKPYIEPPTPAQARRVVAGAEVVSAQFGLLV